MNLLFKVEQAISALEIGCTMEATDRLKEMQQYLQRQTTVVDENACIERVVGALSFCEQKAIRAIIGEMREDTGLLVASKIADENGVKRGAIVNAFRKLESAGIVQTVSLGQKGTMIKAKLEGWREKLGKAIPA